MKELQVSSNEGSHPIPRGDNSEKTITKSPEPLGQFQSNLAQSILERRELKEGITNKVCSFLKKEIFVFSSPNQCYDIIILIILVFTGERCGPWAHEHVGINTVYRDTVTAALNRITSPFTISRKEKYLLVTCDGTDYVTLYI